MKINLLLSFIFFSLISNGQTYSGPESAEYDYAGRRWLIANTSSHQVLSRDSAGTLSIFVSGLGSGPYGIEIVGDTLFCCSGSSVKGFLLSSAAPVFNLNIGASFLNGMTHDDQGNLITTDFSTKKIFKVNIAAQTFTAIASNLTNTPNGIVFDAANNRCVFVNWGSNAPIRAIDMATNVVSTIIPTTLSSCDGITRDGSGNYFVSTWGTQSVVKFDSAFSAPPVTVATNLSSPADIFYNTLGDTLAIPNSGNNTVTFIGFPSTVGIHQIENKTNCLLYPNPVTAGKTFHLAFKKDVKGNIELFSVQGQRIFSTDTEEEFSSNAEFSFPGFSNLKAGIYFIRITSTEFRESKILVIEH